MTGSRLRNSIVALGLVAAAVGASYGLSNSAPAAANAAQPSSRAAVAQLTGPCWHVGVSDWTCPDSTFAARTSEYITSVSITIETRDGKRVTSRLPAGVDAVFLTRDATEKFLLSYYWATNKTKAEALTRKLVTIKEAAVR